MKNVPVFVAAVVFIVLALLGIRFVLGGNEDAWLCQDGQWVQHGNPSTPQPTEPCGNPTPAVTPSPAGTLNVQVYFNNSTMDPGVSCNKVFGVEREIPKTLAVGRAALEELLKGPTQEEKHAGFFTSINPGVKIQKLTIVDGIAKVDFDTQLDFHVGGSCRVSAIRAEITQTLKQFPTVSEVVISIDGRTEDILQP